MLVTVFYLGNTIYKMYVGFFPYKGVLPDICCLSQTNKQWFIFKVYFLITGFSYLKVSNNICICEMNNF